MPGTTLTENGSHLGSERRSFSDEIGKMGGPEYIPKFVSKKEVKRMPKFCKNDAKTEVEIMDLSYLSLEAKIARNYCIYNIFLGFGHVKSDENRWMF